MLYLQDYFFVPCYVKVIFAPFGNGTDSVIFHKEYSADSARYSVLRSMRIYLNKLLYDIFNIGK